LLCTGKHNGGKRKLVPKKISNMEIITPLKLCASLALVGCALGIVTTFSNRDGPSAGPAIIAIRVAHQELYWAKIAFRDPALYDAESHLAEAWSTLKEQRYEQSIFAASEAIQRVRDIKGEVPSPYSERRSAMKLEISDSRDW
jgi:hypothetical protein